MVKGFCGGEGCTFASFVARAAGVAELGDCALGFPLLKRSDNVFFFFSLVCKMRRAYDGVAAAVVPGAGSFPQVSVFRYRHSSCWKCLSFHSRGISGGSADLHALTVFRADGDAHATAHDTDAVLHVRRDGDADGPADRFAGLRLGGFDVVAALRAGTVDFVAGWDPAVVAALGAGVEVVRPGVCD